MFDLENAFEKGQFLKTFATFFQIVWTLGSVNVD